jgi:hypothetical protein
MKAYTSMASNRAAAELAIAQGMDACPGCDAEVHIGDPEVPTVHGEIIRTGPGTVLTAVPVHVLHDDDCPHLAAIEAARAEKDAERATWPEDCR